MNDRTLRLLEIISAQSAMVGPRELAQIAELPQATTYRLLNDMQKQGLIQRHDSGYQVGERLVRLAFNSISQDRIMNFIGKELQALADETGETTFAARLTASGVELFASFLAKQGVNGSIVPPTGVRPAVCSAAKAIYAYLPESQRDELIATTNKHFPDLTLKDNRTLNEEITRITDTGFATCFGEDDPDTGSFAVPLSIHSRTGLLSVGIVGPRTRIERHWLVTRQHLQRQATAISSRLSI